MPEAYKQRGEGTRSGLRTKDLFVVEPYRWHGVDIRRGISYANSFRLCGSKLLGGVVMPHKSIRNTLAVVGSSPFGAVTPPGVKSPRTYVLDRSRRLGVDIINESGFLCTRALDAFRLLGVDTFNIRVTPCLSTLELSSVHTEALSLVQIVVNTKMHGKSNPFGEGT